MATSAPSNWIHGLFMVFTSSRLVTGCALHQSPSRQSGDLATTNLVLLGLAARRNAPELAAAIVEHAAATRAAG